MILLARFVVGVVIGAVAGFTVYKILTRNSVKEEVSERLKNQNSDLFKKAFNAKVKKKSKDSITIDIADRWDVTIVTDMKLEADEVSDEIHIGDIISIFD